MANLKQFIINGYDDIGDGSGSDYVGRDIESLPDVPGLSSAELKARFDALTKQVVAPKFNGLINELGNPPSFDETGIITGNLPEVAENGKIIDSGIPASEVEMSGKYASLSLPLEAGWIRICTVIVPETASAGRTFEIEGFAGTPSYSGFGHWRILLTCTSGENNRKRCAVLEHADNGITKDCFTVRENPIGTYTLYFNNPGIGHSYFVFAKRKFKTSKDNLELYPITMYSDTATIEPTGTEIAIIESEPAFTLATITITASAQQNYSDIALIGSKKSDPVIVMRTHTKDTIPPVYPIACGCPKDGILRVIWNAAPSSEATITCAVYYRKHEV